MNAASERSHAYFLGRVQALRREIAFFTAFCGADSPEVREAARQLEDVIAAGPEAFRNAEPLAENQIAPPGESWNF